MASITPDEGEKLIADLVVKNSSVDRGTNLQLGLFTNSSVGETTTLGGITEPTGGGYARKTLTDASWTGTGATRSYALQTFTATGSAYTGTIYGYFIATTGTTPRLLALETDPISSFTMLVNDTYDVTPNITVS